MNRIRWSDNDRYFGPFTYAKDKYHSTALTLTSGNEEYPGCRLRISAFRITIIVSLLPILRPWREKVQAKYWDAETIKRLGRDWYWYIHEREYGFSLSGSSDIGDSTFLQIFLGPQTGDSNTEKIWCCTLPWTNWRHVRHSIYDLKGNHFATEKKYSKKNGHTWGEAYVEWRAIEDTCPTRTFTFTDFDGEMIIAKTRIEEHQWDFGSGWFKWLSWFRRSIIRRSLSIEFSSETGRRKGSWKGGTIGHSIEMKKGELHRDAFMRYCDQHEMIFKGEGLWSKVSYEVKK